jgi:hypothetical protein
MGRRWRGRQLQRMALRIGLHHPLARVPREVARTKVHAVWKRHPEFTAKQVVASVGGAHPLGVSRTRILLKDCRRAAAKDSPAQKQLGWRLDHRTAARVRVGAIWKRHPEFTAKQVIEKLGPQYSVNARWVGRVMNECWRASARHSPKQLRIGRRLYSSRRGRLRSY